MQGLGAAGMDLNNLKGGKKVVKIIRKKKVMKGGEESWGATGMPIQFYNPKILINKNILISGVFWKTSI